MAKDLTFKTNSIFDSVTYDKDADNWHFYFAHKIYLSACYETYDFSIQDKRFIGLGSGDIGLVEATDNPQILQRDTCDK